MDNEEREKNFKIAKDNMRYFYAQNDGSMKFPNSNEGDQLKFLYKIITGETVD